MLKVDRLDVEPIIGLEIHVQLATKTKMFCRCSLEFGARPNSRVCPVCLGLPGALPVINQQAVDYAISTAIALHCQIADVTKWDRKSYYYPDLPKNYQISQYERPLSCGGQFEFPFDGRYAKVRIRRAHLEEDAGKNLHEIANCTAVDLNRAGTPLLEIVSEPDLHSADQVREFAVQVRRLVRYLGVSEANMQEGQMRFEPNINVRIIEDGQEYLTPIVEIKNLNSFRALHGAVSYEIKRQVAAWRDDGITATTGNKSNRGWDDEREVTLAQREKEEAHDYRYFPDPDLVPLVADPDHILALREQIPELPITRTQRFISAYKLPPKDAPTLVDDRATADLLDAAADAGGDKPTLGRQFLSFWLKNAHERECTIAELGVPAEHMAELADLVSDGRINATAAAQIANVIVDRRARQSGVAHRFSAGERESPAEPANALSPATLARELGLLQSRDQEQIASWVDQALANNEQAVRDALSNPKKIRAARGFLTGQVMRISGGKADPKIVGRLIEKKLSEIAGAR